MQSDELIWQLIGHSHCSYRAKLATETAFCREPNNLSGLCNRSACPLANSRYATIREEKGRCYLCVKTIERAHLPSKLWERIPLSKNYMKALDQITENLAHWPKYMIHKCKQRLTKIVQYLIRVRKLASAPQPEMERIHKKVERRERTREGEALQAANIAKMVEKELLERLKAGIYADIYNFPSASFENVLDSGAAGKLAKLEEGEEEDDEDDELHDNLPSDMHLLKKSSSSAGGEGDEEEEEEEEEDEDEEDYDEEEEEEDLPIEYVEDPDLDEEERLAYDLAADIEGEHDGGLGGDDDDVEELDSDDDDDDDDAARGKGGAYSGSKRASSSSSSSSSKGGRSSSAAATTAKALGRNKRIRSEKVGILAAAAAAAVGRGKAPLEIEYEVEEEQPQRSKLTSSSGGGGGGGGGRKGGGGR